MFKSWRKTFFFNFLKYLYFQFLGLKSYFSIFNIKLLNLGNLKSFFVYIFKNIFAQKHERFAHLWGAPWAIRSWLLIFGERPERIPHGRLFLVSNLSDSLTSLIFGEGPERFSHIAHQKRGNEGIAHFLNKKT